MAGRVRTDEVRDIAFSDDLEPNDKRVRVDSLKWLLSKLKPDRYGLDRLLVLGDQANPVQQLHKTVSVADLSDAQLDRAGGRVVVPEFRLLPLGDGRYDRGRQFMHGLIAHLRRRHLRFARLTLIPPTWLHPVTSHRGIDAITIRLALIVR
jgi:hypothetical protein